MSIISKVYTSNIQHAAIYYFNGALIVSGLTLGAYFLMRTTPFFKHHTTNQQCSAVTTQQQSSVVGILRRTWLLLLGLFVNMWSTLLIFPVYNLGVVPNKDGFLGGWFQDVVTFATFNCMVIAGNWATRIVMWPGPKHLPIGVFLRAGLVIAFFAFSNYMPEARTLPVLIKDDYVYWIGCAMSPLVFGYFTSLLMMYIPWYVFGL